MDGPAAAEFQGPPWPDELGVWLINLPRAHERRQAVLARCQSLGFMPQVVDGVDGPAEAKALEGLVDTPAFERNVGRPVLWGGIGCYMSHLKVWQLFLESDKTVALVLEDDVILHGDFCTAVAQGLCARDHWDMLKLSRIRAKLPIRQGFIGPYSLNAYLGPFTGTAAYLITRQTAARLLPLMVPVTRPTDHEIGRFFRHDFRLMGLEPFPSHPDTSCESLIAGKPGYSAWKFPRHRRLPSYALRLGNYLRRLRYLMAHGMLWPRQTQLLSPDAACVHATTMEAGNVSDRTA